MTQRQHEQCIRLPRGRVNALSCHLALAGLATLVLATSAAAGEAAPPPNGPAEVGWDAKSRALSLRYHGAAILDAKVVAEDAGGQVVPDAAIKLDPVETRDPKDKVEQRLKFTVAEPKQGVKLVLRGTVTGSEEAFPAETRATCRNASRWSATAWG